MNPIGPSLRSMSPSNACWTSRDTANAAAQYRSARPKECRRSVSASQPNSTPAPSSGMVRASIASVKLETPLPAIVTSSDMTPPATTAVRAPASGPRFKASIAFRSGPKTTRRLGQRAHDEPAPKGPAEVEHHPDRQEDVADQARSQLLLQ